MHALRQRCLRRAWCVHFSKTKNTKEEPDVFIFHTQLLVKNLGQAFPIFKMPKVSLLFVFHAIRMQAGNRRHPTLHRTDGNGPAGCAQRISKCVYLWYSMLTGCKEPPLSFNLFLVHVQSCYTGRRCQPPPTEMSLTTAGKLEGKYLSRTIIDSAQYHE